MGERELHYLAISHEETSSQVRRAAAPQAGLSATPALRSAFGRALSCFGNGQSEPTVTAMQQGSRAKSLDPVEIPPHGWEQRDGGITWLSAKTEISASHFSS